MAIDDPLKSIDQILAPDPRSKYFVGGLVGAHQELSDISLNAAVPVDVQQLFATAKNASLYSWFVYRFHPVAEIVGFSALEMALNLRQTGMARLPPDHRSPGLSSLLKNAVRNGWLREDGFPSREDYAYQAAHQRKLVAMIELGADGAEITPPTDEELEAARAELRLADYLIRLWPSVRNALAHGSPILTPRSRSTLRLISEAINQLFTYPRPPSSTESIKDPRV